MRLSGIAAAPGFASGPVWLLEPGAAGPNPPEAGGPVDPDVVAAVAAAQLEEMADQLRDAGRPADAAAFEAQAAIATDPRLVAHWRRGLNDGASPLDALAAAIAVVGSGAVKTGTADFAAVERRLTRIVTGRDLDLPSQPSIVVAADLSLAAAAEIPPGLILGIAFESAAATGDAAAMARDLGVPCVAGATGLLDAVRRHASNAPGGGFEIAVDGVAGLVFARATDTVAHRPVAQPGRTTDGNVVTLLATVSRPGDMARARAAGAAGIGLLRTESLFIGRDTPPGEDEQVAFYRTIFEAAGQGWPVTVQLAELGSHLDAPYLGLPAEANPALGVRGMRLARREPSLALTQIRAISRAAAAAGVEPRIAASMVATLADVDLLNALIRQAQDGLVADGLPGAPRIVAGVVAATASGAFLTREFAPRVAFLAVDTDALTEHVLAADRTNPALAELRDALHPAVLRAIRMVAGTAAAAQRPVTVFGELAGDPAGALVLVGLGVDVLSAQPDALDAVRERIAGVSYEKLQLLAVRALDSHDASEVRYLAANVAELRPSAVRPGPMPEPPTA